MPSAIGVVIVSMDSEGEVTVHAGGNISAIEAIGSLRIAESIVMGHDDDERSDDDG